jgi:hypothetical protein
VLVVGLAALHLRIAVVIELVRLLLDFGLASKQNALRSREQSTGLSLAGGHSTDQLQDRKRVLGR